MIVFRTFVNLFRNSFYTHADILPYIHTHTHTHTYGIIAAE